MPWISLRTWRQPWVRWALRALVLVAVLWGVGRTAQEAIGQLKEYPWQIDARWLVAAGAFYLAGLLPMAWFWRRALVAVGQRPTWPTTLRAYFLGHLGKYVPGKVMVVVLRVGMLGSAVTSIRGAVVATVLETLTMMTVGACLAAVMSIVVLQLDAALSVMAASMAAVAVLPTLPPIARRLAGAAADSSEPSEASRDSTKGNGHGPSLQGINLRLLSTGWLTAVVCWALLGASLWATLQSIGVDDVRLIGDLPLLVATVSLAVVAGFLSLLPGGIGVRDALLMQLLAPSCGEAGALVAAVLVRLVWLMSEMAVCGILYVGVKSGGRGTRSP